MGAKMNEAFDLTCFKCKTTRTLKKFNNSNVAFANIELIQLVIAFNNEHIGHDISMNKSNNIFWDTTDKSTENCGFWIHHGLDRGLDRYSNCVLPVGHEGEYI